MKEATPEAIDAANRVKKLIRQVSLSRLKIHSKVEDLEIVDFMKAPLVYGHWMSLILISGRSLKVTFKTHYMSEYAKIFAGNIYEKSPDQIGLSQAADFVKEFCNLAGGAIKKVFEDQNIATGISLPLVTRGFDEIFFPIPDDATLFADQWTISYPSANLSCSVLIEIYDGKGLSGLQFEVQEQTKEEGGEVDFL